MRGYPATVVIERIGENFVVKRRIHNADFTVGGYVQRWSHFLRQPTKVDSPMQRTTHHEDAKTVFG